MGIRRHLVCYRDCDDLVIKAFPLQYGVVGLRLSNRLVSHTIIPLVSDDRLNALVQVYSHWQLF